MRTFAAIMEESIATYSTSVPDKDLRTFDLRTKSIPKLLLSYAVPAVIGTVVYALYNIVDTMFVGRGSGELGIAAVYIGFPLLILLYGFSLLVGTGASVGVSIAMGRKDYPRTQRILGNALYLTFFLYLITIIPSLIFLEDILRLIGASDNVIPMAKEYLNIYLPGIILNNLGVSFNNVMRASGYPKKAMITMILGALINVCLDYIFIILLGWGVKGAAWATIIAMAVSTIFVQSHFLMRKSVVRFTWDGFRPSFAIIKSIVIIGMAPFFMQVAGSVVTFVLNNNFKNYATTIAESDLAIAAYGIINNYTTLLVLTIIGISQGMQPIVGYNYGSGQWGRAWSCYKWAVSVNTLVAVVGYILAMIIPDYLFALFNASTSLTEMGQGAMRVVFSASLFMGFLITTSQFFQSIGYSRQAVFLSLTRQIIFLLPAQLILPHFLGLDGVWYSMPIGDVLSLVASVIVLWYHIKKVFPRGGQIL